MSIASIDLPFRAHVAGSAVASATIDLSIVVPTFNESKNIRELIARLERTLPDIRWELVFVDDNSADGTHRLVREIARRDPRVRCLQRIGRRGLSSACIEGIFATAAPTIAVMDADLQHDEKILPALYEQIQTNGADVAIGTRYSAGGSTGQWDKRRVSFSRIATRASNVVLKQKVSDPMSGFFMLRREVVENCVTRLSAVGFKILLDILASTRTPLKIAEVPYTFRDRFAGESKLDEMVVWEYAMLLADKTIGRFVPVRFVMFSFIGGLGVFVHLAILTLLLNVLSLGFTLGQTIATCAAMVFNFAINNVLTYRDRRLRGASWFRGLLTFMAACSIGALANVGIATYLFVNKTQWVLAALAGVMVGAVWNYAVTQLYTWSKKS
jgi:dolichol-phosphate mannosyltransferase